MNGSTYYIAVRARTDLGYGPWSARVPVDFSGGPLSAPQNVAAAMSGSMVAVTFEAPASDGGSP